MDRSTSEKCESAFASTIEICDSPSTPCAEAGCISKELCPSTRAAYAVPFTVTVCVHQFSVSPFASVQSNSSSGVSVVACSVRL